MKWTLILAFGLAIAAGCEKSNEAQEDINLQAQATEPSTEKNNLVGTWRLVEYYQDRGDGSGQWVTATETEQITFTASGEVVVSSSSPLATRNFNRYKIVDGTHVELYSTSNANNKDVFYFNREDANTLIFNPQCRENCSRRYKLVN